MIGLQVKGPHKRHCVSILWAYWRYTNHYIIIIHTLVRPTTPTLMEVDVVPLPVPQSPSNIEPIPSTSIPTFKKQNAHFRAQLIS